MQYCDLSFFAFQATIKILTANIALRWASSGLYFSSLTSISIVPWVGALDTMHKKYSFVYVPINNVHIFIQKTFNSNQLIFGINYVNSGRYVCTYIHMNITLPLLWVNILVWSRLISSSHWQLSFVSIRLLNVEAQLIIWKTFIKFYVRVDANERNTM